MENNERYPNCLSDNLAPKGWNRKHTKRRLHCKSCGMHLTVGGSKWFISSQQIELIDRLLLEKLSLRGICRVLKISLSWLQRCVNKLFESIPKILNYKLPPNANVELHQINTELDEMWSFVGNKASNRFSCWWTREEICYSTLE